LAAAVSDQLEIDDEFIVGVSQPTALAFLPDGRVLVSERTGDLVVRSADGVLSTAGSFEVNSQAGEQGLLNVLPHPDFENNHLLYFYYSASSAVGGSGAERHRVVTVELGDDNLLDMSTETVVVQNLMGPANHNGGGLSIYQDYLFVGTGDTGNNSGAPPGERIRNYYPTCFTNAQGKLLRVHLDGSIPSDNPLLGQSVTACGDGPGSEPTTTSDSPREDIFAWGFRNAFRVWADPLTGNVWVGNVGEITYEMIQVVPPSGAVHFGWPFREGNEGLGVEQCQNYQPNVGDCAPAAYRCEQSDGANGNAPPDNPDVPNECDSITGGLILNDCEWPAAFEGRYVFGDYQSERVWTLPINAERNDVIGEREDLLTMDGGPVHFVEHQGALYAVAHSGNGHVTRIAPRNPESSCAGPASPVDVPDGGTPDAGLPSTPDAGVSPGPAPTGDAEVPNGDDDPSGSGPDNQPDPDDDAPSGPTPSPSDPVSDDSDPSDDPGPSASDPDPSGAGGAANQVDAGVGNSLRSDDSGCGCRVGQPGRPYQGAWLVLALGVIALGRRRSLSAGV
jgi:MYXO-CTERM domain-containing protein